jgi:hypothetical protein
MSESHHKLGYDHFLKILTNSPTCSSIHFRLYKHCHFHTCDSSKTDALPHAICQRCHTLLPSFHNFGLQTWQSIGNIRLKVLRNFPLFQKEYTSRQANVMCYSNGTKVYKRKPHIQTKSRSNSQNFLHVLWNSMFITVFSKTLVSILSHVYPFTIHTSGTRHIS